MSRTNLTRKELTLRDELALDRTHLANQRTLLAYFRTGLYLLMTAAAVWNLKFLEELRWLGEIAVGVGILVTIVGIVNYYRMRKKVRESYMEEIE